ncbi:hypothetical protein [Hylemonella gracilis]|uniref:hypothetical protein n=1 Tax=Hylemonella gracilis TaxID=80880 RepID=UPI000687595B|nr:hypothetical protein [Hylemonella gracilis]
MVIQAVIKASKVVRQGKGLARPLIERGRKLELAWDIRRLPSFSAASSCGDTVHVSLSDERPLRGGDVLVAEDGSLVSILAAKQPLMRVSHCAEHGDVMDLARASFQLGKWGAAMSIDGMSLLVERNPEIKVMLEKMHLRVDACVAAFEPVAELALPQRYVTVEPPRRRLILGPATH